MDFEWHLSKATANERKHGVSFKEATEIFADYHSSTVEDPDHYFEEERFVIFGRSFQKRNLVVSFTERDDRIRIISARPMTRRERRAYEHKRG
jgi:uncharacterized protein